MKGKILAYIVLVICANISMKGKKVKYKRKDEDK